jgi:signal transduction histidine kinase
VLLALTAALDVYFLVALIVLDGELDVFVDIWVAEATQWVPAAVFWLVAVRTRFARAEVVLAASAVTLSALGDTYYSAAMGSDGYLPFPSLADVGYVLYYPLMLLAILVLARRQSTIRAGSLLLNGFVASLGAASVLAVLLDPVIRASASGDWLSTAVAMAYPLFDVILLAVIAGVIASSNLDIGPRWGWLVVGSCVFIAADIVYALFENAGTYVAGTPLDASWAVGLAFTAWWVDGVDRHPATATPVLSARRRVPVAALAVVAGLAVLLIGSQVRLSIFALVLAALAVGLAAVPLILRNAALGRLLADQQQVVEQLEELDRSKSELIATVSHELRTPLTSIRGYVELVLDGEAGDLPESAIDMLRVVDHNAERLQTLVDEVLLMSRLEAKVAVVDDAAVDLDHVLERVVGSVTPFADARGVSLLIDGRRERPVVRGDDSLLERAFTNVIENAVKFTPAEGSVRVLRAVSEQRAEGAFAIVQVIDTGIGIPADELPSLFTRFFRASNAQRAAIAGTGLGLSIVQSLIETHAGSITARSTEGVGTTIEVQLPIAATSTPLVAS